MANVAQIAFCTLCLSSAAQAQDTAAYCAAAESEPPLMWYAAQDPILVEATLREFRETYPEIDAEFFRLASGALAARYASERDAGVVDADVVTLVDPIFVAAAREKGWIVSFDKSELSALAGLEDRYFQDGAALTAIIPYGFSYNTATVTDPLSDWKDLLRPEFKGQIALGDPRNVPGFLAVLRLLRIEYGDDFLRELAAQELVVVASVVPGTQQMAAGEFKIVFPNGKSSTEPVKAKGGPVEIVIPEVTTGAEYLTVISEGSDSPNAAKCLYDFLFTDKGQAAFTADVGISPVFGTGDLPSGYQPLDVVAADAMKGEIVELLGLN